MRQAILAAALLALAAAAPASADQLVFDCGHRFERVCRARPDGTGLRTVAQGGSPAITRDGRTLAYVAQTDVFLRAPAGGAARHATQQFLPLLVRFRADGRRFAAAEGTASGVGTQVCTYNTDLSGTHEGRYCLAGGVSTGMDYLPNGRLLMAAAGGSATAGRTVISLLRPEDGGPTGVERTLVSDPAFNLESPAVAPQGRTVAVVQAPLSGGTTGDIAIYDLATGGLIRRLTSGGGAAAPAFSNDGRRVAFDRGGAIWVTRATAGGERRVVRRGRTVAWGGGSLPRAFTGLKIAGRQSGDRVRGRLKIARKGTRVEVELRAGARRAGSLTRRGLRKGTFRFAVKATRRAAKLSVRLTVTPPGAGPDRASRSVRLSR